TWRRGCWRWRGKLTRTRGETAYALRPCVRIARHCERWRRISFQDGWTKLSNLSPHALVMLGQLLGETAEALALLRAAQQRYPDDFWLSLTLGHALYRAKQTDEALGYLRVAIAVRPDNAAAHYNLGTALHAKKDVVGAITAYQKAIGCDPNFAR